jgi:competence protein ComEC
LSIIYFQPKISKLFYFKNKAAKWVWDLVSVSVAAQMGTIPFTLYYFQMFPNYFLPSNMIAVPVSTLILYFAVALLVVSSIPILSTVVAFLLHLSLRVLNLSIVFIENLPYSVSTIAINEVQVILLTLLIFSTGYYFYSKKYYTLVVGLFSALCIFGINAQIKYNVLNSQQMIVYAGNRNTHINFIDGTKNLIYTNDYNELRRLASSFWNNNKLKKPVLINELDAFVDGSVSFNGLRIFILEEDFSHAYTVAEPLKVDYLIIGNGLRPRIAHLLECIEPKNIIADCTITSWYTNQIKEIAEVRNIRFHSTKLNGAYVRKIK